MVGFAIERQEMTPGLMYVSAFIIFGMFVLRTKCCFSIFYMFSVVPIKLVRLGGCASLKYPLPTNTPHC